MNKIREYKYIILIIAVLSFVFYWYEIKPSLIEKECSELGFRLLVGANNIEFFDAIYGICMRNGGGENALEIMRRAALESAQEK